MDDCEWHIWMIMDSESELLPSPNAIMDCNGIYTVLLGTRTWMIMDAGYP